MLSHKARERERRDKYLHGSTLLDRTTNKDLANEFGFSRVGDIILTDITMQL